MSAQITTTELTIKDYEAIDTSEYYSEEVDAKVISVGDSIWVNPYKKPLVVLSIDTSEQMIKFKCQNRWMRRPIRFSSSRVDVCRKFIDNGTKLYIPEGVLDVLGELLAGD
ncbi:hypothetical protein N9137_01100 [Pseudomonadales bacterium]|nr:hypothetical protein [Pseudomonadales bacterium]